jgi:sec-independent protein translocase protein TatC
MPLRDHLAELRNRIILVAIGIAVFTVGGWFLYTPVFEALQAPILEVANSGDELVSINFEGLATALDMQIKVSVVIGVIASSPWWLYHLWAYISPGLKRQERRYTAGFLAAAIPLFLGGVALAWWVFPHAVEILTDFRPENTANLLNAQMFMTFAMRLVLAFGLAFVFPVLMVGLTWSGAVRTRTWLKGWRWAIMGIFVFTAVMTPTPDAITMIVMAIPMCALYFGAIGVGAIRERSQLRKSQQQLSE